MAGAGSRPVPGAMVAPGPTLGARRPGVGNKSYRPGGEWEGARQRALSADPVGVALGRSRKAGEVGDTDQRAVEDDRARSHQAPETPRDVDPNGPDAGGDLLFAEALAGELHPLPGADPFGDSLLVEQPRHPGPRCAERKALGEVHDARGIAAHGLDQLETPSLVSVSARAVTRFWPVAKAEEIQNVSPGRSNTIMTCSRPSTLDR